MSDWLQPLRDALDRRGDEVAVFLRDDDAGWEQPRLDRLLDACDRHGLPIDLAVIPAEMDDERASRILSRRQAAPERLGLHQHGWAHLNHESAGRRSEFGPSRPIASVRHDVAKGQRVLAAWFGPAIDPIFTPPWNRCSEATARVLCELGFEVLSRDASAAPVHLPGLLECPTTVDWFAKRHGVRLSPDAWVHQAAAVFAGRGPVGLLLHHAAMDDAEFDGVNDLLALIAEHPACRPCLLGEAADCVDVRTRTVGGRS